MTTSIELVTHNKSFKYFNSLKIRHYRDEFSIRNIINYLFSIGAYCEPWIPKARVGNLSYDLRIMTIGSAPSFSLARMSKQPITNLHLGNQRCDIHALGLLSDDIDNINHTISKAALCFPETTTIGWDLLLTAKNKTPYIIEGNAFGDLILDAYNEQGDPYDNQVIHWLNHYAART